MGVLGFWFWPDPLARHGAYGGAAPCPLRAWKTARKGIYIADWSWLLGITHAAPRSQALARGAAPLESAVPPQCERDQVVLRRGRHRDCVPSLCRAWRTSSAWRWDGSDRAVVAGAGGDARHWPRALRYACRTDHVNHIAQRRGARSGTSANIIGGPLTYLESVYSAARRDRTSTSLCQPC